MRSLAEPLLVLALGVALVTVVWLDAGLQARLAARHRAEAASAGRPVVTAAAGAAAASPERVEEFRRMR